MKRNSKVNYGGSSKWVLSAGSEVTLASVSVEESCVWTVYIGRVAPIAGLAADAPALYPRARILFGNGGAQLQRDVDCTGLGRACVVASSIDVRLGFVDRNGNPADPNNPVVAAATSTASALICEGQDPEVLTQTQWFPHQKTAANTPLQLRKLPCKLRTLRTYQPLADANRFLLLFDRTTANAPAANAIPDSVIVLPQNVLAAPDTVFGNGRPFVLGLWAAVSTTDDTYTPTAALAGVEFEIIRGDMPA